MSAVERYGVSGDPGGPVKITPRLQPGGYTLAEAFRAAKILAGWEAPVRGHSGGNPRWPRKESARIRCGLAPRTGLCVGEPVCRNLRGEHGDFVGRSKP